MRGACAGRRSQKEVIKNTHGRRACLREVFGGFRKLGVLFFGGPTNRDYSILGSILGSPHFGKLPFGEKRMLATYEI